MEMIEKANFLQRGFILVLLTSTCMVLADYIDDDVSCPMEISCPSIKAPGSDDVIQLVKKKVPRDHPMAIPQQMKGIDLNIVCSIPACLSNPCLHGGTCNETNNGYECHCLFSFTGKRCQESTSTQDDTTTTTTLSTTAADYELTSIQDDTTTTPDSTTTLSPTAANSESTFTQDDTTTTTTTLSTTAADYDEEITTEGSTNPQFSPAPPGWKCTSSKCYRLYDEPQRNWTDAKAFCSKLDPVSTPYGYRLPSLLFLNTEEEAREILALQLGLADWMRVWINCNDRSTEGEFVCDVDGNGTQPSSFWWKEGEPDGSSCGKADCVAVKPEWSELLKWKDVRCGGSKNTMCQFIVGQPEQ